MLGCAALGETSKIGKDLAKHPVVVGSSISVCRAFIGLDGTTLTLNSNTAHYPLDNHFKELCVNPVYNSLEKDHYDHNA